MSIKARFIIAGVGLAVFLAGAMFAFASKSTETLGYAMGFIGFGLMVGPLVIFN